MHPPLTSSLAYLTADVPGVGGALKERPEDFLVEEQPLYPPVGQGEHLYLFLEKRDRTTTDVVRRLARLFNVRRSDVGYAGLKDKHAVTRQHFSVYLPRRDGVDKALARFEFTGLKLLWSDWHTNKLRRGHLAANRFVIYLRQVEPTAVLRAKVVLDRLSAQGVPNFIGEQRFGYRQNNHELGRLLLLKRWDELAALMLGKADALDPPSMQECRAAYDRGDYHAALEHWPRIHHAERVVLEHFRQGKTAQQALRAMEPFQHEFLLNALQSAVFNDVLDERVRDRTFATLQAGDLAWKHDNGAVFAVDEAVAATDNQAGGRVSKLEVSPSGPMWGFDMPCAGGAVAEREKAALARRGLKAEDFARAPAESVRGGRRALRVPIWNADIRAGGDERGGYIRLALDLPKGSFATTVLREIMKPEQTGAAVPGEDED